MSQVETQRSVDDTEERGSLRRRVLVTDDNEDFVAGLAMLLEGLGYEVRTAHDGNAAVETAESFRPDVILLDIGMADVDGYETCRRIRALPWARDTLLLALTGWDQDSFRDEASCFDGHLTKPVEPAALAQLMARDWKP